MPKVFILGLDGASPVVIDELVSRGRLPNFRRLREEGATGRLRTTIPPITGSAWSSFMTGKNPGKHGIFDFIIRRPGTYDLSPINARMRRGTAFWTLAGEYGKKACILNVPVTYPPEEINGIMVSGMLTPSTKRDYSRPPEIVDELDRVTGGYEIHITESYSKNGEERFLTHLYDVTAKREKAMDYLLGLDDWDLFMVVFQGIDIIQHELWHTYDEQHFRHGDSDRRYHDALPRFYEHMDGVLGRVMETCSRSGRTLVVMSDHGAGRLEKLLYVNNFLLSRGFMKLRKGFVTSLKHGLFRLGLAPMTFYHLLLAVGLGRLKHKTRFGQGSSWLKKFFLSFEDVDWARTKAYAIGTTAGQVYINLKGREPSGAVEPGREYEEVRESIIGELHRLRDPATGGKVVGELYRREELYHGANSQSAPDIVFLPTDLEIAAFGEYEFASHRILDPSRGLSASHRMDGIMMMWGEPVRARTAVEGATIMDLAPTILTLLGLPVPNDMDGKVLGEALREGLAGRRKEDSGEIADSGPDAADIYSENEEEELKERLKSLGYFG